MRKANAMKTKKTTIPKVKVVQPMEDRPSLSIGAMADSGIVQVMCTKFSKNFEYPFQLGTPRKSTGTAFFFQSFPSPLLLTCSHVVENATSISIQSPLFGKRMFDVRVVALCPAFDIALLECCGDHIPPHNFISFSPVNEVRQDIPETRVEAGQQSGLQVGDTVQVLGYPLGQDHLKMTQGIVSGHQFHLIQIDSPVNPGNSGGPLLHNQQIIGIVNAGFNNSNDIGYAIPIHRVIYSLPFLLKRLKQKKLSKVVHLPTAWGIEYQFPSSIDHRDDSLPVGVEITRIATTSLFRNARPPIQVGDRLVKIFRNGIGYDVYGTGELSHRWMNEREHLMDVLYNVPYKKPVQLEFRRGNNKKSMTVNLSITEQVPAPIRYVYPPFEDLEYVMMAGIILIPLCLNVIEQLRYYFHDSMEEQNGLLDNEPVQLTNDMMISLLSALSLDARQDPKVMIINILQGSEVHKQHTFMKGDIVTHMNDRPVRTLHDIRVMLAKKPKTIHLRSQRNTSFRIRWPELQKENTRLAKEFQIES
jgi:S1-C subfamily serine protease